MGRRRDDDAHSDNSELDMVNRDPNGLNNHLKVGFDEVLGEPEHAHSIDCVWRVSHTCFTCGKNCCYKFLTLFTGLCIALYWGCTFAIVAYQNIWCFTPNLKLCQIYIGVFREFYEAYADLVCGSVCRACGLVFSRIKVANK